MYATRRLAAAALGLLMLAGAAPAMAQDRFTEDGPDFGIVRGSDGWREPGDGGRWRRRDDDGPRILPPRAIVGSLYRRGFGDVEIKRVRGGSYIVAAVSPRGRRVVAVVDGRTTEITGLRPVDWDGGRRFDDGGWNDPRPWGSPRW
jgi:hypothetical protein